MSRYGVFIPALLLLIMFGPGFAGHASALTQDVEMSLPSIELRGHSDSVTVLAWSPDSTLLASSAGNWDSSDHSIRLWHQDGSLLGALQGHSAPVASLAWSPDGKILASGSHDETIRLWDQQGTLLQTFQPDLGIVFAVDWSPDGEGLVSASLIGPADNSIQVWDADGTLLHNLNTNYSGGKFLHAAWSPDGQYFAGGAIDYRLWRADGSLVFSHESCAHCTPSWGFAWSPDSRMWAIGNESGNVWIYTIAGEEVAQITNSVGNVDVLQWSPDGEILAAANTLWELGESGFERRTVVGSGRLWALDWSPQGHVIATAATNQDSIRLWDRDGRQAAVLRGHEGDVEVLSWSPDGAVLASGAADQRIRLWDTSEL
jgi:WD40 repeat protein